MLTAICFNLDQPKILLSGNGLINFEGMRVTSISSFTQNFAQKTSLTATIVKQDYLI